MINKTKKIKALGKSKIIELAFNLIESKFPGLKIIPEDFEITVWANSKEVIVKFRRRVRYYPMNKKEQDFTYDLSVNLISKEIDPIESWGIDEFYIPTEDDLKNIKFVKESYGFPQQGFNISIYENEDSYHISVTNEVAYGKYYIDKITGKETIGSIQGSYIPKPFPDIAEGEIDKDPLIEIKE